MDETRNRNKGALVFVNHILFDWPRVERLQATVPTQDDARFTIDFQQACIDWQHVLAMQ